MLVNEGLSPQPLVPLLVEGRCWGSVCVLGEGVCVGGVCVLGECVWGEVGCDEAGGRGGWFNGGGRLGCGWISRVVWLQVG